MSPSARFTRRKFLARASMATLAATFASRSVLPNRTHAAETGAALPAADKYIAGKDRRLIVHSVKTGEVETPLELLREHTITPKNLLFVRNNQVLPDTLTLTPADATGWRLELTGLLNAPLTIEASDLAKRPQVDVELVLQCSGNGRARYAESVKASGAQWQQGAMGNVVFSGVRLSDLLKHHKITPQSEARFVAAEGLDRPAESATADFEHSVPLSTALERSILALRMNGELIPKVHGGPLRFVTPGYYGTMNVKWLSRLRFEALESNNHHHVERYRTPLMPLKPGDEFTSTLANSEPNWNMRIKSTIFAPQMGEKLPAGTVTVSGVAWNDGAAKIVAVETSTDAGQTWQRAELTRPASPYAWHHWQLPLTLAPGQHTIWSRAVDALGRSQPLDGAVGWNPAGYTWNGVDAVQVTVKG